MFTVLVLNYPMHWGVSQHGQLRGFLTILAAPSSQTKFRFRFGLAFSNEQISSIFSCM
jgi:hypothetical protein